MPACFGPGTISFPDAGAGVVSAGDQFADLRVAFMLAVMGLGVMAAGLRLRDRRAS